MRSIAMTARARRPRNAARSHAGTLRTRAKSPPRGRFTTTIWAGMRCRISADESLANRPCHGIAHAHREIRIPRVADVRARGPCVRPGPPPPRSIASSRATEVMTTSGRPQGTIASKPARSRSTFSAKPCHVTQRRSPIPIEAILRSRPPGLRLRARSMKTPVRPSTRQAGIAHSSSASMSPASRLRRKAWTSRRPGPERSTIG